MRARQLGLCFAATLLAMPGAAHAMLQISKHKTQNMDCSGGVCTPTAQDAVLNVNDLTALLAAGDVKVFAESSANNIKVLAPFSWANRSMLTLNAYKSVLVNNAVSIVGRGSLTITTNVSGEGGSLLLSGSGKISFWDTRSKLTIDGTRYTLVGDIASLASAIAANPSGTYAFAKDYDARQDGSYPHSPIPTTFTGTLAGLGNTIKNLTIYNQNDIEENIALFSELGAGGQISNLNLTNVSMQTYGGYDATLVAVNSGTITNASATGSISSVVGSNWSIAGLVLTNHGMIANSSAAVSLLGSAFDGGGLVDANDGTIAFSHASGLVSVGYYAGGLVAGSTGLISDSYATGDVTISADAQGEAGGLVGLSSGAIQQSFATGAVSAGVQGDRAKGQRRHPPCCGKVPGIRVGGLVGENNGQISDSYSLGSVNAVGSRQARHSTAGGLVGTTQVPSAISQTYAIGHVSLNDRKYIGGAIGYDAATPGSNQFDNWDLDTSGISNPSEGAGNIPNDPGLRGRTDANLHKLPNGFDPNVWAVNPAINNGYPYLIANPPPG